MNTLTRSFFLALDLQLLLAGGLHALGQTWSPTGAPSNSWAAVACSADGSKLVAATAISSASGQTGQIFTSLDGGTNWSLTFAPSAPWLALASSADGRKVAGMGGFGIGRLYLSTDSGATWTLATNAPAGESIAMSRDGKNLAMATGGDAVYCSTNYGAVWTSHLTGLFDVVRVASSADGTKLAAANNAGRITISTNGGVIWSAPVVIGTQAASLNASADLKSLVAVLSYATRLWVGTSTNVGRTWVTNELPVSTWSSAASSADGTKFIAVAASGAIYSSANAGATWLSNNAPSLHWQAVASTADGCAAFAAASNGRIWVRRTVPTPELRIATGVNTLDLAWIVPSATFKVQETPRLTSPVWTDVTNPASLNVSNLNNEVFLPQAATSVFYRLKSQ